MKKSFLGLLLLGSVLIMPSIGFSAEIELKYQSPFNLQHVAEVEFFQPWFNEFNAIGAGKYKVDSFPSSSVVSNGMEGVSSGMLDFSGGSISNEPKLFPYWQAIKLPFLAQSAVHSTQIAYKLYHENQVLQDEISDVGSFLFMTGNGANGIFSVKSPINKPEDLKGKRVLIIIASMAEDVLAWGGVPVMTTPNDIYIGLQRGMGEAVYMGTPMAYSMRIHEVAKFATIIPSGFTMTFVLINQDTADELTPELKKYIEDTCTEENSFKLATLFDEDVAKALETFRQAGINVNVPKNSDLEIWEKSLKPVEEEVFVEMLKKYGVKDPQGWIKTVKDTADSVPAPVLLY